MRKFVLIDVFNFTLIAAFTSLKAEEERREEVFSSILSSMIIKLKNQFPNATFYACWDSFGGTQFRKEIDPNYKSNRPEKKAIDFKSVVGTKPLYEFYGVKNVILPETEADDVIYVLAKELRSKYPTSYISVISRDHDMIQVVQAKYANEIYDPIKKKTMDIPWYSIVEYKSLVGDSSDNIPGVKGIGPKNAERIIAKTLTTSDIKSQLNEQQFKEYSKCKSIIDAKLHPRLKENSELIKCFLND